MEIARRGFEWNRVVAALDAAGFVVLGGQEPRKVSGVTMPVATIRIVRNGNPILGEPTTGSTG
jgi:hypothetical protein